MTPRRLLIGLAVVLGGFILWLALGIVGIILS